SAAPQVPVFLAVHRHGATSTQLVQAIWPGLAAHTVTGRLYTTLSELRATIRATCGLTIIDHTDDRYRLHGEHLDTDLWRLHTAAHHAATSITDPARAWQAVIDAYTGDLAADYTWPWIDPQREATRRLVLDAYAAAASAQPDPHRTLELLERGIRVDPYNENLHRRAIEVLTALDEHTAAAGLLDAYRRRLTLAGQLSSDTLHLSAYR
ncbi:AfsR/SARP family transcriptional regulator, partial [Micromonospora coerulea]|uniref:AfsR/SARP family transcriptional regulator n=1 Tax=Micromonospora coerulea TaxID=47856 RepID=UPI0031F9A20D